MPLAAAIVTGKLYFGRGNSFPVRYFVKVMGKQHFKELSFVKPWEFCLSKIFLLIRVFQWGTVFPVIICSFYFLQLSGGEKQRVALARAFLKAPAIL